MLVTSVRALRRTFASVLVALGEDPGVVMDEMGHTDPKETLPIYRRGMRREPGEKEALRALVEGFRHRIGTYDQTDRRKTMFAPPRKNLESPEFSGRNESAPGRI